MVEGLFTYKDKGKFEFELDNLKLYVDFYVEHVGGLEGFYSDTYEGNIYINNTAYWFRMRDTFCSETEWEMEREESADLLEGEEEYVYLSEPKINPENEDIKEKQTMTNQVTVATVILLAQDKNAPKAFQNKVVGKFEDVLIPQGEDSSMTILKLAMGGEIQKMLDEHNEDRVKQVNQTVLERTGTEVKLQPLTVEDLQIQIKG